MTVQTTFTTDPAIGAPGLIFDSALPDIITCIAQEDISFGSYVRISGQYCELPDSSGEVTGSRGGVAVRQNIAATGVGYKTGDLVPVLTRGRIWVLTEQAIASGAKPFVRFSGTGAQGAWRNDADTATAVQATNVSMYRGVTGAGLAVAQLDYPNQ